MGYTPSKEALTKFSGYKPSKEVLEKLSSENKPLEDDNTPFWKSALNYEASLGLGLAQGAGNIASNIANAPGAAYEFFTGKQPYKIPNADFLNEYYPKGRAAEYGKAIGNIIGEIPVAGGVGVKGYQLASKGLEQIPKLHRLVRTGLAGAISGAGTGALVSDKDRLKAAKIDALIGAGAAYIPEIFQAGKGVISKIQNITKEKSQNKELQERILEAMRQRQAQQQETQQAMRGWQNTESQNLANQEQGLYEQLGQEFPIIPKHVTNHNLVNATQEAEQALQNEFRTLYEPYQTGEYGVMPIRNTMNHEDFVRETNNIHGLSRNLKQMRQNPEHTILTFEDATGNAHNLNVPGENATVNDYVQFMREVRDAKNAAEVSRQEASTHGEKQQFLKTKNKLDNLQQDIESRIEETIGKDAFARFKNIQSHWGKTLGELKTRPAYYNPAYRNRVGTSMLDELQQPTSSSLRQYLYNRPDFVSSLREHHLQGAQNPSSLESLQAISSRFSNPTKGLEIEPLLSEAQRAAALNARNLSHRQQLFNNVNSAFQNPENSLPFEIAKAKQYSPEAETLINRLMHERAISQQMIEESKKLGLTEKEIRSLERDQNKSLMALQRTLPSKLKFIPKLIKSFQ